MGKGPLDHPRLLAIEERLDRGDLDDAQRMLAALGDVAFFRYATTYLATRLLFARRRIDRGAVVQRLRDLVRSAGHFPEAQAMLISAENGTLEPDAKSFKQPSMSGKTQVMVAVDEPQSQAERLFASHPPQTPSLPSIPRAPTVPLISQPPDPTPSYAPAASEQRDKSLEPPPDLELTPKQFSQPVSQPATVSEPARVSKPALDDFRTPSIEIRRPDRDADEPKRGRKVEPTLPGIGPDSEAPDSSPSAPTSARVPMILSSRPPPSETHSEPIGPPSVIELAALLDGQRYEEAILAIDRAGPQLSPDHVLMRARALQACGRKDEARGMLERLGCAPLLDPEVRSGAARVLLEIGALESAIEQARMAVHDDAEAPLSKITLAWAAVRAARRSSDVLLLGEADSLLSSVKSRAVPMPALVFALRACVQAEIGNAERAVGVAQRALAMDPQCADALAGLAVASARLGRVHDARAAWRRLYEVRSEEAEVILGRLDELGTDLEQPTAVTVALSERAGERSPWPALEVALLDDLRPAVIDAFETSCRQRLDQLAALGNDREPAAIAEVGAALLTAAPVTNHFAPFDFSLWSVARLDAALELLYGTENRPITQGDLKAPITLFSAYIGEALRQAYEGRWRNAANGLEDARVITAEAEWRPHRALLSRLTEGIPLELGGAAVAALAHPGAEPWTFRSATPLAPPCLWDPAPWPTPDALPELAHALPRSVVSRYTELRAAGPLDLSMASLASVDAYLSLIAPPKAPAPEADAPWVRRAAVLLGAYVGEVLRSGLHGTWSADPEAPPGAHGYVISVGGADALRPVQDIRARLLGDTKTSVADYAARVLRRSTR